MKGKIGGKGYKQVEIVFSKIFAPNRSKHNAKLKAIQNGAVTKSDIAKSTEIYSYKVLKDYSKVALDLYNFAQNMYNELVTNQKMTDKAACLRVSREMGHHREDITRHYLC